MTVLDEFLESYLHYSVSQRLFEDRCRQLTECRGTAEERQALVDETLRLATCVSSNVNDTESLIADTVEYIQSEGGDPDLLEAISLITNNLREDRTRADDYNISVSGMRIGNVSRRPRRPQVANPFVYVPDEEPIEEPVEEEEPEAEESVIEEPVPEEEIPAEEEENGEEPDSEEQGSGDPGEIPEESVETEETGSTDTEEEPPAEVPEPEPEPKKKRKGFFGR